MSDLEDILDEGEANDRVVYEDLDATYHMLEELQQVMIETEGEHDYSEEIDRNNAKSLIADLEAIERVKELLLREMDPR